MTLTLGHFLSLGAMLFALAVIGIFLNRKNLIVLLMAIELMRIGKSAFVEQTEASMPDNYKEQLLLKEKDLYTLRPDPKMMSELVKSVYESLIVNQRLTASQIRGSSSSDTRK